MKKLALGILFFACVARAETFSLKGVKIEFAPPAGFHVRQLPESLVIERFNKDDLRYSEEIHVFVLDKNPKRADAKPLLKKRFGSRVLMYSTIASGGGSGGAQFVTTASETVRNKLIQYKFHTQTEESGPDLEILWEFVERTKFPQ